MTHEVFTVLSSYEHDIDNYAVARAHAGKALVAIHDGDLWMERNDCETFLEYTEKRFGFNKSRAYQMLDYGRFAIVYEEKGNGCGLPKEEQIRTLKAVKLSRAEREQGVDEWGKRVKAWDEIAEECGVDIDPAELKEELTQRQDIVPRAKKTELTKDEQRDKKRKEALAPLERKFMGIVMHELSPTQLVQRCGDPAGWQFFSELKEWMAQVERAAK